ncbi:transmembrane amino acid transporter protein-domain-containing protein [Fimicolochytrium jonesii]|uniref:transmembrane amino acid transporter protein-domain-containing protein n=1 Tax=Fimicolochytrium jonesii TaxID=1396493 RepID=UPI0022FEADF7|nr:transmembrane amino acid transporter protein-domain-containing protein [Fimicolochytrium jonesii]KAI8824239.1 transmembrane amino acid transporter protein-domain-containing protein [Fimicolochytrium jonesii]
MGRVRTSFGTPRSNHSSPSRRGSPSRRPPGDGESEPDVDVEDDYAQLTEKEIAKRVSEHLILPDAANEGHLLGSSQGSFGSVAHNLLGGEVTRDIYQWSEKRENPIHRRRNSEPDVRPGEPSRDDDVFTASDLREPGVFRRHFVQRQAIMAGREPNNPVTRNFLDFLALYGFYGGDVYPEDADDDEDDGFFNENEEDGETRPLVRSRTPSVAAIQGTSAKKAFFMVLKAFVGTGVLFLPKAFANGGMLFSLVTLGIIGFLTLHCMLLLVQTSRELGGSFGDIGEHLYGQKMRQLVLGSIAVSQAGFCCAYYIFIAQNLRDFVMTVSDCKWILPDWVFIVIQLVVYIPLSWVRKIKHFSITSLVADVFILLGLAYVLYFDIFIVATEGPARDFVWFNNQSFPLFVGTAMFAFEGICLILPIGESMKHPEQFGKVLSWCTVVIGVIFVSVGSMGYLTFGPKVETVVFLNLPRGPNTQIIQFLYALAIMLSFPLTVYPTIRITEHGLFGMLDGKHSNLVKWQKNLYRVALVACLGVVAWAGSNNLDKFVSLVGCFACIPLSFIYPSLFHSHIATNRWVRMKDMALVVFGIVAMLYTTSITLQEWYGGKPDLPVDRCTV